LSPASLKESTLPGGGLGLFVREDVPDETVFLEYGGEIITMKEARRRQMKVIAFAFILSAYLLGIPGAFLIPPSCIIGVFWL